MRRAQPSCLCACAYKVWHVDGDDWEHKSAYTLVPKFSSISFALLSILIGILSIPLEVILVRGVRRKHLSSGIQYWFLSTSIIFLISLIGGIVTLSVFIIEPLDQNISINKSIPQEASFPGKEIQLTQHELRISETTNVSIKVVDRDGFISCIQIQSSSISMESSNGSEREERTNNWIVFPPKEYNPRQHPVSCQNMERERISKVKYSIRPVLPLSYMIDIIRSAPALFLTNKFVKTERLHELSLHRSMSALYIRHYI